MGSDRVTLISVLSRAECLDRLRAVTGESLFGRSLSDRPLAGRISDTSIRVRKRSEWMANPIQIYLSGKMTEDGAGTRIACRFGWHPLVFLFTVIWFGFAMVIGGLVLLAALLGTAFLGPSESGSALLRGPMLVLGGGVAFVLLGLFRASGERQFLLDFLRDTIDAREV